MNRMCKRCKREITPELAIFSSSCVGNIRPICIDCEPLQKEEHNKTRVKKERYISEDDYKFSDWLGSASIYYWGLYEKRKCAYFTKH